MELCYINFVEKSDSTSRNSHFWNTLEQKNGSVIPSYIRNIMALNNLDNLVAFQGINNDTLEELENFARERMYDHIRPEEDLESYYGKFHRMPEKFKFLIYDRYLIKTLVNLVKFNTISDNNNNNEEMSPSEKNELEAGDMKKKTSIDSFYVARKQGRRSAGSRSEGREKKSHNSQYAKKLALNSSSSRYSRIST